MVFKLVRIDTPESCKIQLEVGNHIIGRGRFLHVNDADKRVSRNHAELEVTDDSVTLKSLHTNPCFYIKNNTTETKLLHQSHTISLSNGDKFGLLPDHFWYEVIYCTDQYETIQNEKTMENNTVNNDRLEGLEATEMQVSTDDEQNVREDVEATKEKEELSNANVKEEVDSDTSASILNPDPQPANAEPQSSSDDTSPRKRNQSQSPSPDAPKKIKTELVTPGDGHAGPSNDTGSDGTPASPKKPDNVPKRERCIYGANCYRRNPQHKAQFSHPSDGDWGAGARGECPYGRSCRKHDARHWAQHAHPPGTQPPHQRPSGPGKKPRRPRPKTRVDSSDDEDSDSSAVDLIMTGKRKRKPLNVPAWSDSASEEDPFNTDGSDEWQPPSDATNSQGLSQSQDY